MQEEHLPNTLRQVLIYEALGFKTPEFGHVSLILAPDKTKLSKRHGATSVGDFREQGFLPEAMVNYLSLLGWNDGTQQVITPPCSCKQSGRFCSLNQQWQQQQSHEVQLLPVLLMARKIFHADI